MLSSKDKKLIKSLLTRRMMECLQKDLFKFLSDHLDMKYVHSTEVHPITGSTTEFHVVVKMSNGMEFFHVKVSNPL